METPVLTLSEQERFLVTALLDDSSSRARRRARILLDVADGQDPANVARALHTRPQSVERALAGFDAKRLDTFSAAALRRVQTPAQPPTEPGNEALTADMTMRLAAIQILDKQFHKLTKEQENVREAQNVEAIHDMRVACRRLNSAFRLFRLDLPAKRVKRLRGQLEVLRDLLGEIRNLDVLGEGLDHYRTKAHSNDKTHLDELAAAWKSERAKKHAELLAFIDSAQMAEWVSRMDAFLEDTANDETPRVAEVLPAVIWRQYGTVRAYETIFKDATLEQLHALRIDIKRLRYTLEFFLDVLARGVPGNAETARERTTKTLIQPLIELQDQLGAIQDAVVGGQELTDFIAAQADDARKTGAAAPEFRAIAAYHAALHQRITELRRDVPPMWNLILGNKYRGRLAQAVATI